MARKAEAPSSPPEVPTAPKAASAPAAESSAPETPGVHDYYVEKDGLRYAGTHLLIDLIGARRLADPAAVEVALRRAVAATGAVLLDVELHCFAPQGGVTAVALLAESHMSIHTWPETGFAAVDVFLCGRRDPYRAIPALREAFTPDRLQVVEHKRGLAV